MVRLRPDRDHVVTRGYCCPKGISLTEVVHDPDRILHPLKKVDGEWRRVTWDDALTEIGGRLARIRSEHGPHAIALYTGNPAGFSYSHRIASSNWVDAIGTRNSYGAGSQDNLGDFLASKLLYGACFLQPIPDVERTKLMMVVAANPAVSQGTLMHLTDAAAELRAVRKRGGKLVVIDPRRSETALLADEHHFIRPDTDHHLLLAMIRTIFAEGLEDRRFLVEHARDVEWLRGAVEPFTPEHAAEKTGIDAATIRRLARELAAAEGACVYGRVVCGRFGTLAAWSLEVLNVVTGNLDRPGGTLLSEGLVDLVDVVARLGRDRYGRHRSRIGDHPDVLGELPAGILADEITTPGDGQIRALVVTAGNPVLSIPNGRKLAAAMRGLELTVVLDFYRSETASLADFVLPCTTYLEREDYPILHTQMMSRPYAQWTEPVIPARGEAKQEWEIFALLTEAMGLPFMNSRGADALRRLLRRFGRDFSPRWLIDAMIRLGPYGDRFLPWRDGWRLSKVAAQPHGVRLPPAATGVLRRKLRTRDRRVHLRHAEIESELVRARNSGSPEGYPFRLIGRRDARSHNSWLHNAPHLMRGERCHRLRMHPADAARLGLADGGRARLRSIAAAIEVEIRITDEMMPGVVSLPHGWGHGYPTNRAVAPRDPGPDYNALVDERVIEPLSGMAFLNGVPVAIERLAPAG